MTQLAASKKQSLLQAIKDLAEKLIAVDRTVAGILGDGPEGKVWRSFVAGYAEFHLYAPRYCLREILPEFF